MTQTDILQLVGTGAIALLGLSFYRISTFKADWFCKYGREALLCAAALQATSVVVRFAVLFDQVSQTDARTINGLVALGFAGIVTQIALTHREAHRGDAERGLI